jgi:hypothetical protein
MVYSDSIQPGLSIQWAVGDNRKDALVSGVYVALRGSMRQTGRIEIDSYGHYSSEYVGADLGLNITGSLVGRKLLLKFTSLESDSDTINLKLDMKTFTI